MIMKLREIKGKEERAVVLTVNQRVAGSSPAGGAKPSKGWLCLFCNP